MARVVPREGPLVAQTGMVVFLGTTGVPVLLNALWAFGVLSWVGLE